MSQTVGAYLLQRLHENGIERVYGYPGDGINGILGGFHEHGDDVEFVQCRHEEIASFAATAHAKFTGEVGVCMSTSGPGAVHLLNGLYDAKLDHQPVVAIVGQQKTFSLGANYQQEIDLNTPAQGRRLRVRADLHAPGPDPAADRSRDPDREGLALGHRVDRPRRRAGGALGGAAAGARHRLHDPRLLRERLPPLPGDPGRVTRSPPPPRSSTPASKPAILIGQGAVGGRRRGDRDRRQARRRRRQGAQRQGCAPGRPALRHRLDRPARDEAQLRDDHRLRHAADDRHELPLRRVAAGAGRRPRRADRHRRQAHRHALPARGLARRRLDRHAARAPAAHRAQAGPLLARGDRGRGRALVGDPRRPRDAEDRRWDQPHARLPRAQPATARQLHPHR